MDNQNPIAGSIHALNTLAEDADVVVLTNLVDARRDKRAEQLAKDQRELRERISDLYLIAFSRQPTDDEMAVATKYVGDRADKPKQAFEDILWALMNTKEFVFNH